MQQQVQEELKTALENQDEQAVGRILTGLFLSVSKSSESNQTGLIQQIQEVFTNLNSSAQSYWQNIASSYTS